MTKLPTGETEHDDQVRIFAWAEIAKGAYPELDMLFAIPNGAKLPWKKDNQGRRFSSEAVRLKKEGLRPGVPDMFLAVPRGPYHGLFIELKHGKNKPSGVQVSFLAALSSQGYYAVPVWEWQDAIQLITNYLDGRL